MIILPAGLAIGRPISGSAGVDDFSADTLGNYTAYEDGASTWAITDGKLEGGQANQSVLTRNGVSFVDGEVSCVTTRANDAGLVLRLQNVSNYYLLVFKDESSNTGGAGTVVIYKRVGGAFTQIGASAGIAFTRGTSHTVVFRANGTSLQADFDGVNKLSVTDSAISAAGLCGPRGNAPSGLNTFDSFTWP